MKKVLLSLGLFLGLCLSAQAQCVGVGGINTVPQTWVVCVQDSQVPTYTANAIGIVPAATPTDIFCLTGSATRTIRVKRIRVTGTAGTAINITVNLTRHTVANTGGTAASTTATGLPTLVAMDSTFPTATATAVGYTANPTIDATAVNVTSQTMFLPVTSTASAAGIAVFAWDEGGPSVSPPVLRGVAQQFCVNLNGVTAPSSGVVAVTATYTEQTQ